MNALHHIMIRVAAALMTGAAATGCFTGIESTPRITEADVRRDVAPPTEAELYLAGIERRNAGQWERGKRFFVEGPRVSLALKPDSYGAPALARGDTLAYIGMSAARSLTGAPVTDLHFAGPAGHTWTYRIDLAPDSVAAHRADVPFVVDLDLVRQTGERLTGRTFYITTSGRRDLNGTLVRCRKFVPVTVTGVAAGTASTPVYVMIVDDRGSGGMLWLNPEARSAKASGSFASMLSLTDVRKRYPSITDKVWDNIVNNRVAPGMTRDECRLALGAPADVIRRPGYGYLYEAWRYDNGAYLMFEDGILTQ